MRKYLCLSFLLMSGLFTVPTFSFNFEVTTPVDGFSWENKDAFKLGIQPAASGKIESGMFGMVRNDGNKFHEGIDIKSFSRNRAGQAIDKIYAVLSGKISHISRENNGSYGKYLVLEHNNDGFLFYTLYAHLSEISENIYEGKQIHSGDFLGIIGDTSNVYKFPKGTEHLHFEIGFQLGRNSFDSWYANKFPKDDKNLHSHWNGLNLSGIDPLSFFTASSNPDFKSFADFIDSLPIAFSVYVPTSKIPEIVYESPHILNGEINEEVRAWNISFSWSGTPLCFTALNSLKSGTNLKINFVSKKYIQDSIKHGTLKKNGETFVPGSRLIENLKIIFGPNNTAIK